MQNRLARFVTIAALAALPAAAFATGTCTSAPKHQWKSEKDIAAQLTQGGYKVKRVKAEGSCYEAYALDASGKRHELVIDPVSGKSVREESEE